MKRAAVLPVEQQQANGQPTNLTENDQHERENLNSTIGCTSKERTYSTKAQSHELENLNGTTGCTTKERTKTVEAQAHELENLNSTAECTSKERTKSAEELPLQSTASAGSDDIKEEPNDATEDVLTTNPVPLTKLIIFRLCAVIACLMWLFGAISFNILFEAPTFAYSNETVHYTHGWVSTDFVGF